jgi:hypothetical protein
MKTFSVINIMAERLLRLINNPGLRAAMGTEGRKCVEANYDHNKEMDGLEGLFNGLLRDKTRPSSPACAPKRRKRYVRGSGALEPNSKNFQRPRCP